MKVDAWAGNIVCMLEPHATLMRIDILCKYCIFCDVVWHICVITHGVVASGTSLVSVCAL